MCHLQQGNADWGQKGTTVGPKIRGPTRIDDAVVSERRTSVNAIKNAF